MVPKCDCIDCRDDLLPQPSALWLSMLLARIDSFVAIERLEAAKTRVEVVLHLQAILTMLQPLANRAALEILDPVPVIVIVKQSAIPAMCQLDCHFIVRALMLAPLLKIDFGCLFNLLAHVADVLRDTKYSGGSTRSIVQAVPILKDYPNDLHPLFFHKVTHTASNTLPMKCANVVKFSSVVIANVVEIDHHTAQIIWPPLVVYISSLCL
mmetsp:Transcript_94024/g.163270  ORF Transcript_94024/g.163270 Transcript_94024/m.163270 type:complete len:210 (-) Transcript_94024:482-1111(-)